MFATNLTPDSKNIESKDIDEVIQSIIDYPTICISTCGLASGGCHSFGESLAKEFKMDYAGVSYKHEYGTKDLDINTFKQTSTTPQSYKNVCITGCGFTFPNPFVEKSNFLKDHLQNIYIIVPPHIILKDPKEMLASILKSSFAPKSGYTITLVTTGIDSHLPHCIGLPSPLSALSSSSDMKEIIPLNCLGLMYIPELKFQLPTTSDELLEMWLGLFEPKKAKAFLNLYFSQISKIASQKNEHAPSVLIITKDESEKKIIEVETKKHGITIIFRDRLSPEDFSLALRQISEKGGLITNNGIQTIIEAILLNCRILYFANKPNNLGFLQHVVDSMPLDLKDTARVILGLSENTKLLNDNEKVSRVHQHFEKLLQTGLEKFKSLKTKATPKTLSLVPVSSSASSLSFVSSSFFASSSSSVSSSVSSSSHQKEQKEEKEQKTQQPNLFRIRRTKSEPKISYSDERRLSRSNSMGSIQ